MRWLLKGLHVIYQPAIDRVFSLRENLGYGIVGALYYAAADFIAGQNKPWSYYLGVGLGSMAVATGVPGAAATMYFVGDMVDLIFFKSPDGSDVRLFLNGVALASVDTFAAAAIWELVQLTGLGGVGFNRLDIVNFGPSPNPDATGIPWLAIGPVTVYGANAQIQERGMDTIVFRIQDAEQNSPLASLPINVPSGFTVAQLQTYVDAVAPEVDALTEGQIVEAIVTIGLTLPTGLKNAPVSGAFNERGGLITFDTAGPRKDSVRIPAMSRTIMPGDSFALTQAAVAAFITRLTTATTAANIRPVSAQNYNFVAARAGKKSFRK